MDEAIEDLREVKRVWLLSVCFHVDNLISVSNRTSSTQGCQRTCIRMHCPIQKPCIVAESLNISRSIIPIDAQRINGRRWVIRLHVQEFHNPTHIVWLPRRLAHQVHLIWYQNVSLKHEGPRRSRLERGRLPPPNTNPKSGGQTYRLRSTSCRHPQPARLSC